MAIESREKKMIGTLLGTMQNLHFVLRSKFEVKIKENIDEIQSVASVREDKSDSNDGIANVVQQQPYVTTNKIECEAERFVVLCVVFRLIYNNT